jgi:DNA polymerase-3 subunit gamma/tau
MSQALYRKWRPQTWDEVIGQQHVVNTLRNALAAGRVVHAYLFAGPRGTGKTTTARLLAKAVNCLDEDLPSRPCGKCEYCQAVNQGRFLDLIEIDAASNTSVEDVRDLRDKINFSPNQGRYKVYIVDEVHMLSTAAFNALLKTLEEPPPHAIFVLATTEAHKIPATVLSRCQRHEFRRIPVVDIVGLLKKMAQAEGIQTEPEALTLIARQSTGAMRDAISLLDQLASTGQVITLQMAQDVLGTAASQAVLDVVEALIDRKSADGLDHIHHALDAGSDPRQFARQIVDYLRDLLLVRTSNAGQVEATAEMRLQMAQHAQVFSTPELLRVIRAFNSAAVEAKGSWQPSLPLEMAFIDALQEPTLAEQAPRPPQSAPQSTPQNAPQNAPQNPPSIPPQAAPAHKASRLAAPSPSPEPPTSPAVSAVTAPQDQPATQTLSDSWPKILAAVRQQNPKTCALLNSFKSRYMHGDILVLCFASDLLKSQMEKRENLEIVQQALYQVFQRDIRVQCSVDTAKRDAIPPGVDDDGMVAAALRDLGGELADIQ